MTVQQHTSRLPARSLPRASRPMPEVAKMTVRRALEVLRERGLVRTLHGRGSVVVTPES